MRINEAKDLIKTNMKLAMKGIYNATEFQSGPGMGKSSIHEQAVAELSLELGQPVGLYFEFLSTKESIDVRGIPHIIEGRAEYTTASWMPGPYWKVFEDGKARAWQAGDSFKVGALCLDEFRQASHDTQKPSAELFNGRRVGESQLPDGIIVTACSNRESDRSGVNRELAFLTNRRMVINIEPNLEAWVNWAEKTSVHPLAIAFARVKPGTVFGDKVPEKPGPFCTPRSLVRTSHLIGEMSMETFTECAAGWIGEGAAGELVAFLRVAEQLPKFEDIVAAPEKVAVPTRPDASYAAMQMIAHRVSEDTAIAAFKYLSRMGKEFQVAGLRGTFNRVPGIVRSPEFATWLRDNKALVMAANLIAKK